MTVRFLATGIALQDSEIKAGAYDASAFSDEAALLLNLMSQYLNQETSYPFTTSGSTGTPKPIDLSYEQLSYSAAQTLKFLEIGHSSSSQGRFLLCISPKFIGGAMVAIRAIKAGYDLDVVPANTLTEQLNRSYLLASLVPLQVEKLQDDPEKLSLLRNVLIGGAPLSPTLEKSIRESLSDDQQWYATYGMTETASHVALRRLGEASYHAIGDAAFALDDRECLNITGTVTQGESLQTNDVVELTSPKEFVWKGRHDLIINTGGVKVSPEKIEAVIRQHFPDAEMLITWIPDASLGQKVVCLSDHALDLSLIPDGLLHRYELPKEIHVVDTFPKTENGKPDRSEAQKLAERLSQQ